MSYRMACDHADAVAAIASLAGATFLDPEDCGPVAPVNTLQIHGTNDGTISYNGGCILGNCYPSAIGTTETWATYDGCALVPEQLPDPLDLDRNIPGAETTVTRYATDCDPGGSAQLWTIAGGAHSPNLTANFSRLVVEFLLAHPKPSVCPEDVDDSGGIDFDDVLRVLAAWGPCEECPEDVDASGEVDFSDLLRVLAAWGPCGE
jgi:polyhydroxybutyrate depolymerase